MRHHSRRPKRLPQPERVQMRLDAAGYLGECVGRVEGLVVFAAYGLPGEEVVAELEERRSRFARGRVVEVISPADGRVEPPCPYYGVCGGCSWQHASYETELAIKAGTVEQQLHRIGGLEGIEIRPIIGSGDPWRYRNQARFSPTGDGRLGFTRRRDRQVVPVDDCLLMQQPIADELARLRLTVGPVHQVIVRCGARTGDVLVDPPELAQHHPSDETSAPPSPPGPLSTMWRGGAEGGGEGGAVAPEAAREGVEAGFKPAPSWPVAEVPGDEGDEAAADDDAPAPVPAPSYREVLLGRTFRVSMHSFFQVNTRPTHAVPPAGVTVPDWVQLPPDGLSQADVLALLVLSGLDLHGGEAVLDAYCGVGTFALLAAERAARVVGIEESRSAVSDAEANAAGLAGVTLHVGKVETVLPELEDTFDAAVLDPARVGCASEALRALLERPPRRLVYVSCDLATLARDLKVLCESAYRVVAVQPLDMFPRTHHIESVTTLERREGT